MAIRRNTYGVSAMEYRQNDAKHSLPNPVNPTVSLQLAIDHFEAELARVPFLRAELKRHKTALEVIQG